MLFFFVSIVHIHSQLSPSVHVDATLPLKIVEKFGRLFCALAYVALISSSSSDWLIGGSTVSATDGVGAVGGVTSRNFSGDVVSAYPARWFVCLAPSGVKMSNSSSSCPTPHHLLATMSCHFPNRIALVRSRLDLILQWIWKILSMLPLLETLRGN